MAKIEHRKIDLCVLARELEKAKTGGAQGGVSFSAFEMDEVLGVLASCVQWSLPLPDHEKNRILNAATFAAGRKGTITIASLENHISDLEQQYRRQPQASYVLATTLSIQSWPWNLPRSVKLDRCTITFSRTLPKHFDRSDLTKKFSREFERYKTKDFAAVRVHIKGRSLTDAAENAFETIDFLRGLWNLSLNRTVLSRSFSGRAKPVNRVRLGPIHTLHHPDGSLAAKETYWYDPFYSEYEAERLSDADWYRINSDTAAIRKRIAVIPYGDLIRDVVVRYARVLDSADFEKTFLKLWTLLEMLTDTSASQGYDHTIRRALFIWSDSELNVAVLEHLRTFRNSTVHSGFSSQQIDSHTYRLKRYVEQLLLFHLFAKPPFPSIHAAGEFLEISRDPAALRARIKLLERAVRFRLPRQAKERRR